MLQLKSSNISSKTNTREKTNHPCIKLENKKEFLVVQHTGMHAFASRSFSIYGPNLWHSLPDRFRGEISFKKFKKKLKAHLFTTAYM